MKLKTLLMRLSLTNPLTNYPFNQLTLQPINQLTN